MSGSQQTETATGLLASLFDALRSDWTHLTTLFAYEVEDRGGRLEEIKVYEVAVKEHKDTGELKYVKQHLEDTIVRPEAASHRRVVSGQFQLLHLKRDITIYRYDALPDLFG